MEVCWTVLISHDCYRKRILPRATNPITGFSIEEPSEKSVRFIQTHKLPFLSGGSATGKHLIPFRTQ